MAPLISCTYTIFTDSACDMPLSWLEANSITVLPLTFRFESEPDVIHKDYSIPSHDFYQAMREGAVAHTSANAPGVYETAFRSALEAGQDILYLGFSSGLSGTCNAARLAADGLRETFPERQIHIVDTLCASAGLGLLLHYVVGKRNAGATVAEAAAYAEELKLSICHRFTVDDLVYLRRGGRISAASAAIGSVLGIKPILHMDNDGHLVAVSRVRGRRTALLNLIEQYKAARISPEDPTVFICQADCPDDAAFLANRLAAECNASATEIVDIGAVIGSHSGPGTISLFFLGKER